MVNETITFGEDVMHIGRIQLLAAIAFLAGAASFAPTVAQEYYSEIHGPPLLAEADAIGLQPRYKLTFAKVTNVCLRGKTGHRLCEPGLPFLARKLT